MQVYLPDERDIPALPRQVRTKKASFVYADQAADRFFYFQWIINVFYTVIQDPFADFVR